MGQRAQGVLPHIIAVVRIMLVEAVHCAQLGKQDEQHIRIRAQDVRRAARQIVVHGHIRVNGQKVDIPSYSVKVGDVITLRQKSTESELFKPLREGTSVVTPKWLTFDAPNLTGKVVALPTREDVSLEAEMSMIVEFYSR